MGCLNVSQQAEVILPAFSRGKSILLLNCPLGVWWLKDVWLKVVWPNSELQIFDLYW